MKQGTGDTETLGTFTVGIICSHVGTCERLQNLFPLSMSQDHTVHRGRGLTKLRDFRSLAGCGFFDDWGEELTT
jgi:hypothetical protein